MLDTTSRFPYVKLNTDGSASGVGDTSAGEAICDEAGNWLVGSAKYIGKGPRYLRNCGAFIQAYILLGTMDIHVWWRNVIPLKWSI